MCYGYNRDFGWDVRKDASQEPEKLPETRVEEKEPKFRAFPRHSREFTAREPETAPADWIHEKV